MTHFIPPLALALLLAAVPGKADEPKQPAKDNPPVKQVINGRIAITAAGSVSFASTQINSINLLRMPQVKEEIKLTDEQDLKINEAFLNMNNQRRELYTGLRNVPANERAKKVAELQKKVRQQQDETYAAIRQLLEPEQATRLEQIAIQRQGLNSLTNNELASKLKFSDDQREKIAAALQANSEKIRQLSLDIRNGAVDRTEYQNKRNEIQAATEKMITTEIMTMAQQTRFDQMKGEPFDLGNRNVRAVPFPAIQFQVQPLQLKQLKIEAVPEKPKKK